MKVTIRQVEDGREARDLVPILNVMAEEAMSLVREEPLPPGALERFLERSFEAPETLLLVAEVPEGLPGGGLAGLLLTGPFSDPLAGDCRPMILVLSVNRSLRHRGLAGALVTRAREIVAERGLPALAGRTEAGDDVRISMGERWGFLRVWEVMVAE
jgi:GNAT superfamily N-acetyltransferase